MAGKKPRSIRRAQDRETLKQAQQREKLANLEPGGAPSRPIEVVSASLVEITAESMKCPRCGGALRVDEHVAQTSNGVPLRIAWTSCRQCGHKRPIYFRITTVLPN
jgi:DNA-directed RNA polymerase subunit RPC12/RpoP